MSLADLLHQATEIATIGGNHTLKYFRKNVEVLSKADESPVTIADRETEEIMRAEINKRFPGHGIIGEEYGLENEDSDIQWILDPIDGTKSFIHGVPLYTTLIGITINGIPQVGIINAPASNEICTAAIGKGANYNGEACKVSEQSDLRKASLMVTEMYRFHTQGLQPQFMDLMSKTKLHRTWGDAYGHMMVAIGRADIMFDPILNIWDAAALLPVIKEAGGVYSDMNGVESIETGSGISTNPYLHEQVLNIILK